MGRKLVNIIKELIKKAILLWYKACTKLLAVNKNIILFESNLGRNYTGNPKAIYEEMVHQGLDKKYKCYFILEDVKTIIPGEVKKVKKNRLRYFYLFAIAGEIGRAHV